ncbi:hypothetical protein P4118_09610 [Pseudomonas aeruginosa]|nr:hypothetical protein [Pseudomonas aeruginosa]
MLRPRRPQAQRLGAGRAVSGAEPGAEPGDGDRQLVATSVPELDKSQVTVVDQKGNLLSDQQELSELTMAGKQFDFTRRKACAARAQYHGGAGQRSLREPVSPTLTSARSSRPQRRRCTTDQPALRSEQRLRNGRVVRPAGRCRERAEPAAQRQRPQQATAPADYVARASR